MPRAPVVGCVTGAGSREPGPGPGPEMVGASGDSRYGPGAQSCGRDAGPRVGRPPAAWAAAGLTAARSRAAAGAVRWARQSSRSPSSSAGARSGCCMQPVAHAKAASLREFLLAHVQPGAVVISDGWRSYPPACAEDYEHRPEPVGPSELRRALKTGRCRRMTGTSWPRSQVADRANMHVSSRGRLRSTTAPARRYSAVTRGA